MSGPSLERIVAAIRAAGLKATEHGHRAQAQCPAHEDRNPSLSVTQIAGQALVRCHAGCETADVLAAVGLTMRDLFDEPRGASYRYTDRAGSAVLRTVVRTPEKRFYQQIVDKAVVPLYRLPEVTAAVADKRAVVLVEGEKDVHALESLDLVATTAPQGAKNFDKVDVTPLTGAHVIAIPDRDAAGAEWAAQVAERVGAVAERIDYLSPQVGKDAADHVAAGYGIDDFDEAPAPSLAATTAETAVDGPDVAPADAEALRALWVADEAEKLRVRRDARDVVRTEEIASTPPPPAYSGTAFLAKPRDDQHLVDGLIPATGKFLIAAAAKAGKTTTMLHVVACLLSGRPLFGAFPVRAGKRLHVHLLDNEMGDSMLAEWLGRLGLTDDELERLTVHSLLGYASTFDPTVPASRAMWAERLRGGDVVLVDCLSPFMQAVGLDENHDAGRWLVGLDELMAAAGVDVYGVAHHTGHEGERARGDSKILGWPFQMWTLNREADKDDDEADDAPRFLKARGRCGSIPSGQIELTADGLTYRAGTTRAKVRADATAQKNLRELLTAVADEVAPGQWFGVGKAAEWVGKSEKTVRSTLSRGVGSGLLETKPNPTGAGKVFALVSGGREGRDSLPPPDAP